MRPTYTALPSYPLVSYPFPPEEPWEKKLLKTIPDAILLEETDRRGYRVGRK